MTMSQLPVIQAAAPVVVPPVTTATITYDKLWLANLSIQAFDVTKDAIAYVELVRYAVVNGVNVMMPGSSSAAAASPSQR